MGFSMGVLVYDVEVGIFLCGSSYGSRSTRASGVASYGGSMVWVLLWVFW